MFAIGVAVVLHWLMLHVLCIYLCVCIYDPMQITHTMAFTGVLSAFISSDMGGALTHLTAEFFLPTPVF